ncbi:MAG: hypothetical protein HKP19_05830 [Xanthomonadales bacterium]|nr:hypothetical protein [Xanthomonadales bacterium]
MTSEHIFVLVIVGVVALAGLIGAAVHVGRNPRSIAGAILNRLNTARTAGRRSSHSKAPTGSKAGTRELISEADSQAELKRLKAVIEERKRLALETDISHHLWGLYKIHFRSTATQSLDPFIDEDEWYKVKTVRVSSQNGLREFEFELKGARYTFTDDEERQGWSDNIKYFSLSLYDSGKVCMIEIPMKLRVDKWGSNYSISSDGPRAFIPGDWIKDFISVKLKHQHLRNREMRAQKHKERLSEIEDLKDRFGIWD